MSRRPKTRANGEGSIYKTSDGRWRGSVTTDLKNGRQSRKYVSGRSHREVRTKLTEIQRRVDQGLPIPDDKITVGALAELWLESGLPPRLSPGTVENYTWAARKHIVPGLGSHRVRHLRTRHVNEFLEQLETTAGLGSSSRNRVRVALTKVLDYAIAEDLADRNVARLSHSIEVTHRPGRALTLAEVQTLINTVWDEPLGLAIVVAVVLSIRIGEVFALRWSDIGDGSLTVSHARVGGRDRETGRRRPLLGKPKTATSTRTIALNDVAIAALTAQRRRLAAADATNDEDLVFPNKAGGVVDPSNARRFHARMLKKAGLPPMTPRELRHTALTLFTKEGGVSTADAADAAGHANDRMLRKVYIVPTEPVPLHAPRALNGLLSPGGTDSR